MKYIEEIKDKYNIDELKHSLFRGDNRKILKTFPDKCVDLIYMDPPFFSGKKYTITAHEKEIETYSDMYVDSDTYIHTMYESLIELYRVLKDTGSIFLHCDWRADYKLRSLLNKVFGEDNFLNGITWHYTGGGRATKYFSRQHHTIFSYTKIKNNNIFNIDDIRVPYEETSGYAKNGITSKKGKKYMPNPKGTPIDDVWYIAMENPMSKKRIKGFKTQKPMELLERIIRASSNKGDVILDPFMGSGTTLDAAYTLGRIPIGIDVGLIQINITLKRCDAQCSLIYDKDMNVYGMTGKDIEDYNILIQNVEETKKWHHLRFEKIMCMLEGAEQKLRTKEGNPKYTQEKGVDGERPNGEILQVKHNVDSGPVGHGDLRDFMGALKLREQKRGTIVAYSFSKPLIEEVNKLKREKKLFIELKTPTDYKNLIEIVDDINKEIEQEKKEQMNQQTLDFS